MKVPSKQDKNTIINEEEFVALMDAEYKCHKEIENEIDKKKVWDKLNSQIKTNQQLRWKIILPSIAVSLVALIVIPTFIFNLSYTNTHLSGEQEIERSKGTGIGFHLAKLLIYQIDINGVMQQSSGNHAPGDTLVFKIDVVRPLEIALLMEKNNRTPEVRVVNNVTQPGIGRLIQQDNDNIYGYKIEPEDRHLKFCLFVDDNQISFENKLRSLEQIWDTFPLESCAEINVVSNN